MKDQSSGKAARKQRRESHAPLAAQILSDEQPKQRVRTKTRARDHAEHDLFIDDKLSKKILSQAHAQQLEENALVGIPSDEKRAKSQKGKLAATIASLGKPQLSTANAAAESDDDDAESANEDDDQDCGEGFMRDLQLTAEDELAVDTFISSNPPQRRTLGDFIRERITEKMTEVATEMSMQDIPTTVDPKVAAVFTSVGKLLSRYRSGKLPKAFRLVPSLSNWEDIVYLMQPVNWTAAAMYQATKVFASNLNAKMAQRFFNLVLLPRVRDDIDEFKMLNYHLYQALKKCLYKPAAFFKGILIPLCESGTCTLREAVIIGSVLAKVSVPFLHSAAAMLKIAEMDYTGANSIFLRILIDKKYALPFRVIDALVYHFLRFEADHRVLPVLWHQCLYLFAQRYKNDITSEQKEALLGLLKAQTHPTITPMVRFELTKSESRGGAAPMEIDE